MGTRAGKTQVQVSENVLAIAALECRTPDVVQFFREASGGDLADLVCRALAVGVTGLRAAGVTNHIQAIKHEFERMSDGFRTSLEEIEVRLIEKVDTTFDPEEASSVAGQIGNAVTMAHDQAAERIEAAKAELDTIIKDSFNPDLATSAVARLFRLVNETKADLERLFDPSYDGSYLARLAATVDQYFGDDGTLAVLVSKQIIPLKEDLEREIRELRDMVAGQSAAAAARRKSSLSGTDFEDEVEEELRCLAKANGDSVERVGTAAGDAGASKKGDFVVEIREGLRFVVEAKDRSNPVTLRGDNGINKALDSSMTNRDAGFAICVMKEETGFPREVGAFNDYDGDKILCLFGDHGELLEVAYRWARATLLSQASGGSSIDVEVIQGAVNEARAALRELNKIDAKAKAIVKNADEISSLVAFQLRRARCALDEAERGLADEALEESA